MQLRLALNSLVFLLPSFSKCRDYKSVSHLLVLIFQICTFYSDLYLFIIYFKCRIALSACTPTCLKMASDPFIDGYELSCDCWELNLDPEQSVYLTVEPSHQPSNVWFKKKLFLLYVCECFSCMCICAPCVCLLPPGARIKSEISWNWGYRRLWATMWVLGTKSKSFAETASNSYLVSHLSDPSYM